ncbi:MAG: tetratricopeptide repeat protein [Candidatus Gracilibacteria bacterium]|nr:MAG: hypothetical protein US89_C0013G0056 [Candidatus Peregrinibacteria bacterium GW2011_GWF2_38_29]
MSDAGTNVVIEKAEELKQAGEHEQAIKLCERVLMSDLECAEAYEEIGDNFLSLKEYFKAKKALEMAIKINPESANANYLIGFLYSCFGKWKTSIEYLEKADKVYQNHPEILRCLGWSMYHEGHKVKGIVLLERSLSLSPEDPLIMSDLGVIYMNEKNFEKAEKLFSKVVQIEPGNKKAEECLNAIRFFRREYDKLKKRKA